jgi:hypothetical protein
VVALANCGGSEDPRQAPSSSEAVLAVSIEKQVSAEHPDFDLNRYIRLYTRGDLDVEGTYLFEGIGGLPSKWKGGKSYWVTPDAVPQVLDGGCAVISLRYNLRSKMLVSVSCNGDA